VDHGVYLIIKTYLIPVLNLSLSYFYSKTWLKNWRYFVLY